MATSKKQISNQFHCNSLYEYFRWRCFVSRILCTFIFILSRKLGHYLHPASWMLCIGKENNAKLRFPIFFSSSNFFSSSPHWEENKWWMKKIYNPVPTLSKSTTVAKITIGSQQQQQHYIKNIVFRLSMYVHETPLGIY